MEMGISEDVYSPVCKFNLANITYYSILLPNLLHKLIKKNCNFVSTDSSIPTSFHCSFGSMVRVLGCS